MLCKAQMTKHALDIAEYSTGGSPQLTVPQQYAGSLSMLERALCERLIKIQALPLSSFVMVRMCVYSQGASVEWLLAGQHAVQPCHSDLQIA